MEVYNGGLVQYLYISVGESMDLKLTVDEYLKISGEDDPCTFDYSANLVSYLPELGSCRYIFITYNMRYGKSCKTELEECKTF